MLKSLIISNTRFWRLSFWIVVALLLYLTITPTPPKPIHIPQIDKLYHCIAFTGTTFLLLAAYQSVKQYWVIALMTSLGVIIEIIQYFVPGRGFSIADMVADFVGVLVGVTVFKILTK